jgi:drug/metabolite transporter (DMT)-like permease
MIALALSIFCSTIIFVLFKLFKKFGIDTFQAIVFNYFTAFIIGVSLYHNEWNPNALQEQTWMFFSVGTSILFIGLFLLMAFSSQSNGVASTSIAVKMSMAISLIIMIISYGEEVSALKTAAIILAILGVFLVSYSGKNRTKMASGWMLLVLFIGSGTLDFTLNLVQKHILQSLTASLFSAISLGLAGIIGSAVLIVRIIQNKTQLRAKNLIAGIILGVPNFFSIYLLLLSYKTTGWTDSTVLAITNVSVVLFSAVIGFLIFSEEANKRKIIGLIAAISAIVSLYFAN